MAKEVVNNEYVDIRGRMHNQWVVDSDRLWQTEKKKLEYPKFPPYPSEEEIVKRARILENFLYEKDDVSNMLHNSKSILLQPQTYSNICSVDSECNVGGDAVKTISTKTTGNEPEAKSLGSKSKQSLLGRYFYGPKIT
jgi:hypothetical protein